MNMINQKRMKDMYKERKYKNVKVFIMKVMLSRNRINGSRKKEYRMRCVYKISSIWSCIRIKTSIKYQKVKQKQITTILKINKSKSKKYSQNRTISSTTFNITINSKSLITTSSHLLTTLRISLIQNQPKMKENKYQPVLESLKQHSLIINNLSKDPNRLNLMNRYKKLLSLLIKVKYLFQMRVIIVTREKMSQVIIDNRKKIRVNTLREQREGKKRE